MEGKILEIEVKGSEKTTWNERVFKAPPSEKT